MPKPNRFDGLLHECCVGYGWCGSVSNGKPLHVTDFIPATGIVTADDFVDWLLVADGVDPKETSSRVKKWKTDLRAVFVKHMGADQVDASALQWEV